MFIHGLFVSLRLLPLVWASFNDSALINMPPQTQKCNVIDKFKNHWNSISQIEIFDQFPCNRLFNVKRLFGHSTYCASFALLCKSSACSTKFISWNNTTFPQSQTHRLYQKAIINFLLFVGLCITNASYLDLLGDIHEKKMQQLHAFW